MLAPRQAEAAASWVLEGGDSVEQLGMMPLNLLFQIFDDDAVFIHLYADNIGVHFPQHIDGVEKGGTFDQHSIARIDKNVKDQVNPDVYKRQVWRC